MKRLLLFLISIVFTGSLLAQLSTEDFQILYLDFDDETDLSYTDYDFDLNEEVDMVADEGKFAGGAWFDGEGSRIVFDPIEDWNHGMEWTLSMWLKTDVQEDFWGIAGFGTYSGDPNTDYYDEEERVAGIIFSSFEGVFEIQLSWLGWAGPLEHQPEPWNDGEWHQFVVTYSAENDPVMTIYLDNVEVGAAEEAFNIAEDIATIAAEDGLNASLDDDHIRLGFAGRGWLPEPEEEFPEIMFYEGFMDDVRLFNAAFTPEQVDELFAYNPEGGTGIENIENDQLVKVYPNPANEYIMVEAGGLDVDLRIYDVAGQLVKQAFRVSMVDISDLSKGMYMVESLVEGSSQVQKLIVE